MEDDMKYLDTLIDNGRELQSILTEYDLRMVGMVGKANLIGLQLERINVLLEVLKKQERVLRFLLGEPVEPMAHSAEAILVGVMGGDAA